ncbi:MAG: hypothetical protein IPP60_11865 [Sphingobacteriales bacterium]|nr:hypothetical protein [Sphingobacteriales bacterium]
MLTNDGELAQKLSHPSGEVTKVSGRADKALDPKDLLKIRAGVELEGKANVDQVDLYLAAR